MMMMIKKIKAQLTQLTINNDHYISLRKKTKKQNKTNHHYVEYMKISRVKCHSRTMSNNKE